MLSPEPYTCLFFNRSHKSFSAFVSFFLRLNALLKLEAIAPKCIFLLVAINFSTVKLKMKNKGFIKLYKKQFLFVIIRPDVF